MALSTTEPITPNQFEGTDSERIQAAIDAASGVTNLVVIPSRNANGANRWIVDRAVLLPSDMTVVLDNATVQLADSAIDNIFRSDNVTEGQARVSWNYNIRIVGVGESCIKGAANPRSTGGGKVLTLESEFDSPLGRGKMSYGTDAGEEGVPQKGNWRNHGILMAYVDGFVMSNVTVENTGCWAITFERVRNADLSHIKILNPPRITVDGTTRYVANRDGINLRQGCKHFRIHDISGETGDDFIALTLLGVHRSADEPMSPHSAMATHPAYTALDDDIEDVWISSITCKTKNHGVALRTIDQARIHDVFIDGLRMRGNPDVPSHQTAILFGGRGYGGPSPLGNISNVHATGLVGSSRSGLVHVEARIEDCTIANGIYHGESDYVVTYHDFDDKTPKYSVSAGNAGRSFVKNVIEANLVHAGPGGR